LGRSSSLAGSDVVSFMSEQPSAPPASTSDGTAPVPTRVGRYEVVCELGRGMMGIVYEARDPSLGRTVALKTIEEALASATDRREEFEQRFFAEARSAARLSHPGIVVCHDVGKDPITGTLFIVLEYLTGHTLADHIKNNGALDWPQTLRIVAKLARAIDHAHKNGVVHRDLKPPNIMLLDSGDPKIMDFGIAKMETARLKLTAMGQSLGSPLYMSPEQALGNETDARTDIFSLGSVLCTLLLGRPYFAAANIPAIIARIIHEDPPQLSALIPMAPPGLDWVLGRSMARAAKDRYPAAIEMAEDLEDLLADRAPRHADQAFVTHVDGTVASGVAQEPILADLSSSETLERISNPFDELDTLVPEPIPEETRPAAPDTWELRPLTAVRQPPPRQPTGGPWLALIGLGILALAVVLIGGALAWRRIRTPPPAIREPPAEMSTGGSTEPSESAPNADKTVAPDMSRLTMSIKHRMKNGRLRLLVDGAPLFETNLRARGSKKLLVTIREEVRIETVLSVAPGHHEIQVVVSWDDNKQAETLEGDFRAGEGRQLEARIGGLAGTGLNKDLALEWK
jgi:serine/threonine-protein kinase